MINQNQQQTQKKALTYKNENVVESLRALGGGVVKSVAEDVIAKVPGEALNSLFGQMGRRQAAELRPNQNVEVEPVTSGAKIVERQVEKDIARLVTTEKIQIQKQIESIRQELNGLAISLKTLNQEVKIAINQSASQTGVYHLNFFERLKGVIQILRQQVEDSQTWLSLWTNRKKQKGYWGMFKKHGTSFGMSHERALATPGA